AAHDIVELAIRTRGAAKQAQRIVDFRPVQILRSKEGVAQRLTAAIKDEFKVRRPADLTACQMTGRNVVLHHSKARDFLARLRLARERQFADSAATSFMVASFDQARVER